MSKTSRIDYCQYLLSSQINYTLTNFADHIESISHDKINRYLKDTKLTPSLIYEHVKDDIVESAKGYILFDDTVIDKDFSHKIEVVRRQYSGNAHGLIKGIGVVTCVYVNPELEKFWVIDYRIFDPDKDGKSKIDHVDEMLSHTEYKKSLPFHTVLVDSWYATHKLILKIDSMGKLYYCPLKKNRLVDDESNTKPAQTYKRIDTLTWNSKDLAQGKTISINKFPKKYKVKLFQSTISTNRTEHIATNAMDQDSADDVRDECAIRWKIEEFHREAKQLTGLEKCQCRIGRIQRNHIACAMLVWVRMKHVANAMGKTIYRVKHDLMRDYLVQQLRSPAVAFA
jgi:hypothetical protein